eukprot:SAG31_NODE_4266_length_3393_cov_4.735883_3_plen_79_part_00
MQVFLSTSCLSKTCFLLRRGWYISNWNMDLHNRLRGLFLHVLSGSSWSDVFVGVHGAISRAIRPRGHMLLLWFGLTHQ